jgi:thiazole synthase ThiGH ThiG subunit
MQEVDSLTGRHAINPSVPLGPFELSRIWHCFGSPKYPIDLRTALDMLDASETSALPVNTHALGKNSTRSNLIIGFGTVCFDELADLRNLERMTIMLNINHQCTASAAVERTKVAFDLLPETAIKLEVLDENLRVSNDHELVNAVERLRAELPHLRLMPLCSCTVGPAQDLVALGCPLLRVMGSPIGSRSGIVDPAAFEAICNLGPPIILDGGIGSVEHFRQAHSLGAAGCLVNSMLFGRRSDPVKLLSDFVRGCAAVLSSQRSRNDMLQVRSRDLVGP